MPVRDSSAFWNSAYSLGNFCRSCSVRGWMKPASLPTPALKSNLPPASSPSISVRISRSMVATERVLLSSASSLILSASSSPSFDSASLVSGGTFGAPAPFLPLSSLLPPRMAVPSSSAHLSRSTLADCSLSLVTFSCACRDFSFSEPAWTDFRAVISSLTLPW
ncbi:hypothetical protein D9M69_572550 [compost metagenome]